jgi:hypothetical protein
MYGYGSVRNAYWRPENFFKNNPMHSRRILGLSGLAGFAAGSSDDRVHYLCYNVARGDSARFSPGFQAAVGG